MNHATPPERGHYALLRADRLGLLYAVALVFAQAGVALQTAKNETMGERVEDRFVVSGAGLGQQPARDKLGAALLAASRV